MCGIAGMIRSTPGPMGQDLPRRLLRNLEHRGPDDQGALRYFRGRVWLGKDWEDGETDVMLLHRRLSILDLSPRGWQPMGTPDGRYYITFNGEIYNYIELRAELEKLGWTFRSQSDTEVLLAAFAHWGTACLPRLIGMFAFAVLDTQARKLTMVRDFFGIKPLYYAVGSEGLIFGSELKTVLEAPWIKREAHPKQVFEYLRYGLTNHLGTTFLADVQRVPPAHYLEVSIDKPAASEPVRYWRLRGGPPLDISFEETARRTRDMVLESLRLHMRSDVPVGSCFSGGVDSSTVVMGVRRLAGEQLDLHTFSYVTDDPSLSEEYWMDLVGKAARASMHKVNPHPQELIDDLDQLVYHLDEPFANTSIYVQYRVFRLAHEHGVKVMLDGQGADEIFGGYRYHVAARIVSLLRRGRWIKAASLLRQTSTLPNASMYGLAFTAIGMLAPNLVHRMASQWFGARKFPPWLNMEWFRQFDVAEHGSVHAPGRNALSTFMREKLLENPLPQLLRYEDRTSMAFSVESRVPFLTPQLADFAFSLPEEHLIAATGMGKRPLRESMRGIVPDEALDRRLKIGMFTPEHAWLKHLRPWIENAFASDAAATIPALNMEQVRAEWKGVLDGKRPFNYRIWRWLNLIRWTERFNVSYPPLSQRARGGGRFGVRRSTVVA